MKKLCWLDWIALILVVVGAVNWGLVGAFQFDLVYYLLGAWPIVAQVVYIVVGVAGIYLFISLLSRRCCCEKCECKEE